MSEVKRRVKETLKSSKEFLVGAEKSIQEELSKTTPKLTHTLDTSIDKAGQGLSNALTSIEKKTSVEQLLLLKAYRSFLQKQVDFVNAKIKAREKAST
ncbi:MAG: hypothetical protein HYU39_10750 [Thaumarchaeota archaeon]|nr:hypothetical protein [Nitrososphaerota archaeon]